jgi:RNA polymerase sigma factor (sigma-70 family)
VSEADELDRALLERWRSADDAAGNALLERHFGTLVRFLRAGHSFSRSEITELVQRCMVACVESRERIPQGVSFRAYLLGIARRLVADTYRADHRRRARDAKPWPQPSIASPSKIVAAREEERLLLRSLQQLPRDLQVVIQLHYWEQMNVEDIASVCEIPAGTVKSRLRRARERLLEEMRTLATDPALLKSTAHGLDRWASALRAREG